MWEMILAAFAVAVSVVYWIVSRSLAGQKWVKFVTAYVYLRITKKKEPLFNFDTESKDLGQLGVVSLPIAWAKDSPRPLLDNIHASDGVRVWGVSEDGGVLVYIEMSRRQDRVSEVSLFLRLEDKDYQLPMHPDTNVYNTDGKTFTAAGLSLDLLEPLRRWRINFKGYLRRVSNGSDDDGEIVSANFNFLNVPLFNYASFPEDYNLKYLSGYLAKSDIKPWELFERLSVERHALFSIMHGNINIDGDKPREVRLRGLKERAYGTQEWKKVKHLVYLEAGLKVGTTVRLFVENVEDGVEKFMYGYVCPPCNMTVHFVSDIRVDMDTICGVECPVEVDIPFTAGGCSYHLKMRSRGEQPPFKTYMGREREAVSHVHTYDVTLNGLPGNGIIHFITNRLDNGPRHHLTSLKRYSLPLLKETDIHSCKELVVTFDDVKCRSSDVVGGKAASLALMTTVQSTADEKFQVPSGVSVTKTAFELQEAQNPKIEQALSRLNKVARSSKQISTELAAECEKVVQLVANTPVSPRLKEELMDKLIETFGEEFNSVKFAVRSSAIGEDGEEMSAAGQNETFLGIKGLEQVCSSISKCWASQFSFRSVEYKRQNGQLLNSGMGVVIQQMVPAQSAGVLFSREPLTGSPTTMIITSNYGLGESVVSATADPDTITIRRSHDDQLSVQQINTGSKKTIIQMSGESGTEECETEVGAASRCSVSEEDAIRLANIALFLEKCFGNGRDIEWAIVEGHIYILQSRPVTTDSTMTDFEVMHEFDTPIKTENEYFSTANVGEVMPGSTSVLSLTSIFRGQTPFFQKFFYWKVDIYKYDPIVFDGLGMFYGHAMFDLVSQKMWSLSKEKNSTMKAFEIGIFGRVLDDGHITQAGLDRFKIKPPFRQKIMLTVYSLKGMLFGKQYLNRADKTYKNYHVPIDGTEDMLECYNIIGSVLSDIFPVMDTHMSVTMASTMWNMITLNLLSQKSGEYSNDQYADFALLVGSCNGAESGNVPASLAELATAISLAKDLTDFGSMNTQEALESLQSSSDENVQRKFKEFLNRHGHRGLKEFDLSCISWGIDPKQVVSVLQGMINTTSHTIQKPKEKSSDDVMKSIKSPLSPFKKWLLRIVMKFCRTSVCHREHAKSLVIKYYDSMRLAFRHLARLMINEGLILDENLIFFFTYEEIGQVIQTRSPKLIRRAKTRQRLFAYMDKLKFPEMIEGFPQPINDATDQIAAADIEMIIKGLPVSQGVIEAKARVVTSFHDVNTIQPGEILITHATDIGWSPYFPMLAGIVTEIGGLISHGAVVAREFGLPCIVGVDNATKLFQSGDLVRLNATQGTIMKIKHADKSDDVQISQP